MVLKKYFKFIIAAGLLLISNLVFAEMTGKPIGFAVLMLFLIFAAIESAYVVGSTKSFWIIEKIFKNAEEKFNVYIFIFIFQLLYIIFCSVVFIEAKVYHDASKDVKIYNIYKKDAYYVEYKKDGKNIIIKKNKINSKCVEPNVDTTNRYLKTNVKKMVLKTPLSGKESVYSTKVVYTEECILH